MGCCLVGVVGCLVSGGRVSFTAYSIAEKGATAHGLHAPARLRSPPAVRVRVGGSSAVRQCYLFSVDNIGVLSGGILQQKRQRKTAHSMCPITITHTTPPPNTDLSNLRNVISETLPMIGDNLELAILSFIFDPYN